MKRPLLFFCILLSVISIVRFYISRDIAPPGIDTREEVTLQGKLVTWEIKSGYTVLYLSNVFFYDDSVKEISQNNSIGIRCFTEDVCEYKPGQQIALRGFLALPGEATNPGEFNEAEYYRNKGYNYVLYRTKVLAVGEEYDVLRHFLSEVRRFFQSQLSAYLHPSDVGVMSAMLLGDKSNLEMETKDLYREMGVYHILAISGVCTLSLVSLRPP